MAKAPKKPKLSTGKASKPDLKPLDPYLADLLNPAVNREREAAEGFAERAQETFIHGDIADVDPALAKKLPTWFLWSPWNEVTDAKTRAVARR